MATLTRTVYANIVYNNVAVRTFTTDDYLEGNAYYSSPQIATANLYNWRSMYVYAAASYLYRDPTYFLDYFNEGKSSPISTMSSLQKPLGGYPNPTLVQISSTTVNYNQNTVVTDGTDLSTTVKLPVAYWILS